MLIVELLQARFQTNVVAHLREKVTREARREFMREVKLSTGDVEVLLFADDMVIMAESDDVQ